MSPSRFARPTVLAACMAGTLLVAPARAMNRQWISTGPAWSESLGLAEGADGSFYAIFDEESVSDQFDDPSLFVSTDSGRSWADLGHKVPANGILGIAAHPAQPATLVVRTRDEGMLRSTDGGATWRGLNRGLRGEVLQIEYGRAPPHRLYAVVSRLEGDTLKNPRLFRFKERSRSWKKLTAFLTLQVVTHPTDPELLYVRGWDADSHELFRSENGGSSWERADFGLERRALTEVVFTSEDRRRLYAAARRWVDPETEDSDEGGFFATRDGRTWEMVSKLPPGSRILSLSVNPDREKEIVAGLSSGYDREAIIRSRDGGRRWKAVGVVKSHVSAVLRPRYEPNTVLAAGDGGLYRSVNRGRTWRYLDGARMNTARITDVVVSAPGVDSERWIYAFGWQLFRRRESDEQWETLPRRGGARPRGLVADPADSERLYYPTYGGVAMSQDAGETWSSIEIPRIGLGEGDSQLVFENRPPYRGYLALDGWGLLTTADGGETWRQIETPLGSRVSAVAIDPRSPRELVIGGPKGVVRSSNRGRTWDEPTFKRTRTYALSFDPHTEGGVWAIAANAFGDRALFRSRDGGRKFKWVKGRGLDKRSWVYAFQADPFQAGTVYVGLRDLGCYGGCGGVQRSIDGGKNWELGAFGGLPPVAVSSLAVSPTGHLYAGTHQRGVYSIRIAD